MGALTIRNLDDEVITAIKRRAADNGVSMEEEIRRLLAATYADDRRRKVKEWAQRQLERLHRGELPNLHSDSVELIRSMREERDQQLMEAIEGRGGPRR